MRSQGKAEERLHHLASEGHDAWDQLPTIAAPTLVIHGSDDRLNPTANAPLLAERISGAELYIVLGGRHGYFEEFRKAASRVVLGFLARIRCSCPHGASYIQTSGVDEVALHRVVQYTWNHVIEDLHPADGSDEVSQELSEPRSPRHQSSH